MAHGVVELDERPRPDGTAFGHEALIGEPLPYTATAATDVRLLVLPADVAAAFCTSQPTTTAAIRARLEAAGKG